MLGQLLCALARQIGIDQRPFGGQEVDEFLNAKVIAWLR